MTRKEKQLRILIFCVTCAVFHVFTFAVAHGQGTTNTIALTGEQAGGTPGAIFDNFNLSSPLLNNAGQVAFLGNLEVGTGGVNATNDQGIWRGSTLVAREGSAAGDTASGIVFNQLNGVRMNDAGQVAYFGELRIAGNVTTNTDSGIWLDSTLVAREGSQAGGVPMGAVFDGVGFGLPNNAGQVAYAGLLRNGNGGVDGENESGFWRNSTLIAREGRQAAGTPAGAAFDRFFGLQINDAGQTAFLGRLKTGSGGVNSDNARGIWRDSTLVAREGSQAGDVSTGATFSTVGNPGLNNAGQLVYFGLMNEGMGGVDATNNKGIWRDSTLVAREGSRAGGTPFGAVFDDFSSFNFNPPPINNAGQVAYVGTLRRGTGDVDASNDTGIWRDSTLIIREGTQAEGTASGTEVQSFEGFSLQLNDNGQIAYSANLRQGVGGVDSSNDKGIWIAGTNGESLLVAREGNSLAGKVVSSTSMSSEAFNDFSQVAYKATFTDGEEGMFLYTPDIHYTPSGSGSWDDSSNWTIGQRPGDPHDVFIDPTVSLTVTGPTADVSMTNLTIGGGNGIATLALNGGTINLTNAVIVTSTGVLTGDGVVAGDVINNGLVSADNVTIDGTLANNNLVNGSGRINAMLSNSSTGLVSAVASDQLRFTAGSNTNAGRIEAIGSLVAPAEIQFDGILANDSTGEIFARNASLRFDGGMINDGSVATSFGVSDISGAIINNSMGSVIVSGNSDATFYDDFLNNGEFRTSNGSSAVFFGEVSGAGNFAGTGTVFFEGGLSPGNSPGILSFDSDIVLGSGSTTLIELGGLIPGEYDQMLFASNLTVDGELQIEMYGGFMLEANQEFLIADVSGSLFGKFIGLADGDLVGNFNGHDLFIGYSRGDGNDIGLFTAVPEPGAFAFLGLMAVATVLRRRA